MLVGSSCFVVEFYPMFHENIIFLLHRSFSQATHFYTVCISKSVHFKASLQHILKGLCTVEVVLHNVCAFRMSVKSSVVYIVFWIKDT